MGTHSLWIDTFLILNIVVRALHLPQAMCLILSEKWMGGGGIGGENGRKGSGDWNWYVKWKKNDSLFYF